MSKNLLMTGLLVTNLTVTQASNSGLASEAKSTQTSNKKWGISLSTSGGYSNLGEGSGKVDLFIPIAQNSQGLTFIDLRGQLSGNYSNDNYSIAVGHRRSLNSNVAVGINTSYDTGSSVLTGDRRDQLAVGLEVFSEVANVKVNFFRALSDETNVTGTSIAPVARITDGQFQLVKKLEDSEAGMNGFSVQVDRSFNLANDLVLDVMAMAYAYGADNAGEDFNGVMASATLSRELDVNGTDIEVSGTVALDNNNRDGFNYYVGAGLSVNINRGSEQSAMDRAMGSGLSRQMAPMTSVETGETQTLDGTVTLYGQDFTGVTSEITAVSDVQAELDAASADQLVLLSGTEGEINITSGINLNENQVVIGKGIPVVVKGPNGEQAVLILPNSDATLANGKISLGNGSVLAYTNIDNADIAGWNADSITLDNNSMTNVREILFTNVTDLTVSNNTITGLENFDIVTGHYFDQDGDVVEEDEDATYTNTVTLLNNTLDDVLSVDIIGAGSLLMEGNTLNTSIDPEADNTENGEYTDLDYGFDSNLDIHNVDNVILRNNDVFLHGEVDINNAMTVLVEGGTYESTHDDAIIATVGLHDDDEDDISIVDGSSVIIDDVTVTGAGFDSVDLNGYDNVTVVNSNLTTSPPTDEDEAGTASHAIEVDRARNIYIANNTLVSQDGSGIDIDAENGGPFYEEGDELNIPDSIVIENNSITASYRGISIDGAHDVLIDNNTIVADEHGIYVGRGEEPPPFINDGEYILTLGNVTISRNTITTNGVDEHDDNISAIRIEGADSLNVNNNTLNGLGESNGFNLENVTTAVISSNILSGFDTDVRIDGVADVLFELNKYYKSEDSDLIYMHILGENGLVKFLNDDVIDIDTEASSGFSLNASMLEDTSTMQKWEVVMDSESWSVGWTFYCEVDFPNGDFRAVNCSVPR